jgi:hypothetical protein
MGALATRVRFFQQQGCDATLAVSSGVLISMASWITKGALLVVALPVAISQFDLASQATSTGGGSGASGARLVWIIVIAIAVVGMLYGLIFAIPRWRRLAAAKLRPKASEVWCHLKILSTHPHNLVETSGGEVGAQALAAFSLGAALHAFDQHLSLDSLIIVLTLGSMTGGILPVPGCMEVVAGVILGLPRPTSHRAACWPLCSFSGCSPPTSPTGAGSVLSGCASTGTCSVGGVGTRDPRRPDGSRTAVAVGNSADESVWSRLVEAVEIPQSAQAPESTHVDSRICGPQHAQVAAAVPVGPQAGTREPAVSHPQPQASDLLLAPAVPAVVAPGQPTGPIDLQPCGDGTVGRQSFGRHPDVGVQ